MGLALPLIVGAPVVLLAQPSQAVGQNSVTSVVTSSATGRSVYGEEVRAIASVTDEGSHAVTAGTVQFYVRRAFTADPLTPVGGPVALDGTGHATSPPLAMAGLPLEVSMGGGAWEVSAFFTPAGGSDFLASNGSTLQRVDEAATTSAILAGPTTIVADVTGKFPGGRQEGSLAPTGAVAFTLDGAPIGSANLVNGQATLDVTLPNGRPHTVTVTYAGDTDDHYLGSQQTRTRSDPTITAQVLSRLPKSSSGWYRTSVSIWFTCDPAGSELVVECPDTARLRKSGKDQSLSRTILAKDGGSAAVTVGGIDIDRDAPVLRVVGATCTATDRLSGVKGRCHLYVGPRGHYRAVARDKAGNRAVEHGVLDDLGAAELLRATA